MKKILLNITILLSMMLFVGNVYADSFSATLIGNSSFTDQITLKLQISNYQDNNSTCQGICAFSADYSYDASKLELVSVTALSDFRLVQGNGTIVLSKATGVGNGSGLVSFTFKNKGLSNNEETTFRLTNLNASNSDDDITGNNVSKTIKYVAPATQTTTTKPSSSSSVSTTQKTTAKNDANDKKSSVTNLKELTISSGNLVFSKDILNYNVVVANDVNEVTIAAKAAHDKAKVSGIGKYELKDGENKIEVKVTAEDGSTKTYIINVTKDTLVPTEEPKEVVTPPTNNGVIDATTTDSKNNNSSKDYMIPLLACIVVLSGIIVCLLIKLNKMKRIIQNG